MASEAAFSNEFKSGATDHHTPSSSFDSHRITCYEVLNSPLSPLSLLHPIERGCNQTLHVQVWTPQISPLVRARIRRPNIPQNESYRGSRSWGLTSMCVESFRLYVGIRRPRITPFSLIRLSGYSTESDMSCSVLHTCSTVHTIAVINMRPALLLHISLHIN